MISPQVWAARRLRIAVDDAVDSLSYRDRQALAIHGRSVLVDLVSASIDRYPIDADEEWRDDADAAYSHARAAWLARGDL